MRHITTAALCAVVALAIGVTSASAALPEFGVCKKEAAKTQEYDNSACTDESAGKNTGAYKWIPAPGAKPEFKLTAGALKFFMPQTANKAEVQCKGADADGQITAANMVGKVVITFKGCTSGTLKCVNQGALIKTNNLTGPINYIEKSPITVGLDLAPEAPATQDVSFKCGAQGVNVRNSVIGVFVGNVDVKSGDTAKLEYTENAGKQLPENFEGVAKDTLETEFSAVPNVWWGTTLTMPSKVTFKEHIEIKAE
jgi:hypothetical protein